MNERRHIVLIGTFRMPGVVILVTVLLILAMTGLAKADTRLSEYTGIFRREGTRPDALCC